MRWLFIIAILLVACSPQKRLQRLLDKHPEFTRTDTITVTDTLIVKGDTAWRLLPFHVHDTIRIDTGRLHVRVVRLPGDTVRINASCDTDTVIREIRVPVDRIVPCPQGYKGKVAGWWRVSAVILFVLLLIGYLLRKVLP